MPEQRGAVGAEHDRAVDDALEVVNGPATEAEPSPDPAPAEPQLDDTSLSEVLFDDDSDDSGDSSNSSDDLAPPAPRAPRRAAAEPVDEATLRSRRAFARRQWRRRWLAWRHVLVLVLAVVLLGGGIWAVYFSAWLQVKGQSVHGDLKMTNARQVARVAAVPKGEPLATADLKAVRIRLLNGLPMVRTVDVSREWPDKVRIEVTERTPVAVVDIGGRLRALDETGAVFWDYPKPPAGLPMVTTTTGTHSNALREAAAVISALPPDLARRVDHIEVRTVDSITLALRGGKEVGWGSRAQSATKAKVLVALMKAEPKVDHYDVSVPGQPVTSN